MEPKGASLRASLDETELERLSFIVYKKAMTLIGYTGTVLALGLVLFALFGFNKWKDISANVADLEDRTTKAEKRASSAQDNLLALEGELLRNKELFNSALEGALIETGRMRQVGAEAADLGARIDKQEEAALRRLEAIQKDNGENLDISLKALREELDRSAKSRTDVEHNSSVFRERIEQSSAALSDQVARSSDAGFTVLVLQDKHSTSISAKGQDVKIALGNARSDRVDDVVIEFGAGFPVSRSFLKPNDAINFRRLDTDGKMREYSFRIRDINMLAFRDLVTCDLSWELVAGDKVARADD